MTAQTTPAPKDVAPATATGNTVTMFIKTVPARRYVLVLEASKHVRNAEGDVIDTRKGDRCRFDENGRYSTSDAGLAARIRKSKAFGHPDARQRIEVYDPEEKARQMEESARAMRAETAAAAAKAAKGK